VPGSLAEGEIAATLELLRPNRTALVIAHRTNALRHCDIVFALGDGKVVGSGEYGQLVAADARAANS
jgi:ABC-type transport system involved in Fe-S cluster assembly fused permease/ATPase subunit